ncbi:hypothetical protein [Saccharothrix australiensis]|uniref:Uncharacterized protein n=1 Tax=Saccharothrix australiensis TaxID=2072 RepID=A0A495VTM5_9PSEU|nr:hypothetical protein [Saccharothrix australiensis]RKT52689.1 hypothetical protein C8E97_1212 [Saccharothrix australiensis]
MLLPLVAVVLLTACTASSPMPDDPDQLVLRVRSVVGAPTPSPAEVPEFSLYGDGRVIRPGPRQGALRTAEVVRVDRGWAEEVRRAAHRVGLARNRVLDNPAVVDGAQVVFVLRSGGQRFVTRVHGLTDDSSDDLAELARFRRALAEYAEGPAEPHRPTRFAAVAHAPSAVPAGGAQLGRPWPFTPFRDGRRVAEGQCVVLSGADVRAAQDLAREGVPDTRWSEGTTTYHVVFRPLLPDETGCADLDR